MIRTGNRLVALAISIIVTQVSAIAPTFIIATPAAAQSAASAPKLSEAQLEKLIDTMPIEGKIVTAEKRVTDTLGLTKNNETLTSRALTVKERAGVLFHQIQLLPGGKGYLFGNIGPTTVQVFWADKNLVLVAAMTSVKGGPTAGMTGGMMVYPTPVKEAAPDFSNELAYWATVADAL